MSDSDIGRRLDVVAGRLMAWLDHIPEAAPEMAQAAVARFLAKRGTSPAPEAFSRFAESGGAGAVFLTCWEEVLDDYSNLAGLAGEMDPEDSREEED